MVQTMNQFTETAPWFVPFLSAAITELYATGNEHCGGASGHLFTIQICFSFVCIIGCEKVAHKRANVNMFVREDA